MFVLGTAGHIDHGKSVLVHALTGIDPDRLREEKERGMTIDLGFAWLKLPSGREVGIVDVPGHERFIKNMLAGVGGIDLALLVVAANESVMPQTREHLAILDLLGIKRGIVALTKKDLVDDEWLALVKMEVEELLAPTALAEAPIIPVSSITGEGLPELRAAIDEMLSKITPRKDTGRPRLPVDRIFTIAGSGTVVTGTLIDGSLKVGQEVEIVPPGIKTRLRGLQVHKSRVDTAGPGSRVAANIVGVNISQLTRGDILTIPGWLVPARMLSVKLSLLPYLKHPVKHNAAVSLHTGAAESEARVRLLDKEELKPGESGLAQLMLDSPVAAVSGDHFIIRSPVETLGGGRIIDTQGKRYRRFRTGIIQTLKIKEEGKAEEVLLALLEPAQPAEQSALLAKSNLPAKEAQSLVDWLIGQNRLVAIGQGDNRLLFTAPGWTRLMQKAQEFVTEYHRSFPLRPGMPRGELSSKLKLTKHPLVLQKLVEEGVLAEEGTSVRLPAYQPKLNPAQQAQIDAFLKALAENPYSPPTDQLPEPDLLGLLIDQQKIVRVSQGVFFSREAYDEIVSKIVSQLKAQGKITLAEVRDLFQTSRKYAQAIMEHLDEKKITKRVGDERVLY